MKKRKKKKRQPRAPTPASASISKPTPRLIPPSPIAERDELYIFYCKKCAAESAICISQEELDKFIEWHARISPGCVEEFGEKKVEEDASTPRSTSTPVGQRDIPVTHRECAEHDVELRGKGASTSDDAGAIHNQQHHSLSDLLD